MLVIISILLLQFDGYYIQSSTDKMPSSSVECWMCQKTSERSGPVLTKVWARAAVILACCLLVEDVYLAEVTS